MTTTRTNLPVVREIPLYASRVAFDERRVGAAAVYCSDGRWGEQMDEFLHDHLRLPRYDRLAVPGGAACLAGHLSWHNERAALERQLRFLVDAHKLGRVVLIAHENCAFYHDVWLAGRTLREQQALDLRRAAELIRSWHPSVELDAYFARNVDDRVTFDRCPGVHAAAIGIP
jgi:carbonic anhydrase-like protein